MGFLSKLKQAKNYMTGGGASVTVQADPGSLSAPFAVTVSATLKDTPMKINKVYAVVRAEERIKVQDKDEDKTETVRKNWESCRFEVVLSGAEELQPGQTYTWSGEITIPGGNQPTYHGRDANHCWYVMGALDKSGNDPDSGWTEVAVTT